MKYPNLSIESLQANLSCERDAKMIDNGRTDGFCSINVFRWKLLCSLNQIVIKDLWDERGENIEIFLTNEFKKY